MKLKVGDRWLSTTSDQSFVVISEGPNEWELKWNCKSIGSADDEWVRQYLYLFRLDEVGEVK
jgi:hypothetical protein